MKHRTFAAMLLLVIVATSGCRTHSNPTTIHIRTISCPIDRSYDKYIVQKGDTLTAIANRFSDRDTLVDIVKRNEIDNPDLIHPGQVLLIERYDSETHNKASQFTSQ